MIEIPKKTLEFFGNDELKARVFYEKYALKDVNGNIIEELPTQMWARVAKALASVEKEKKEQVEKEFYWLLEDFKFVPGGRILFAAGTERKSSLLNCYYIPLKEDSIEGIFDTAKEMARTYSFGGGVGIDISILRPKNSLVNNAAIKSTGSVSFMSLFSLTTSLIGQSGRRGALMITMDVRHPDIEDFVTVKKDKTQVKYANISVKIDDNFMRAVKNKEQFELHFKNDKADISRKVNAAELWNKILDTAINTGDPGLIFWDRVKRESPTEYDDKMAVKGTNPCAEQPLEDYGACDLGSLNLGYFVDDEYTDKAKINWEKLEKAVRYAVRFLDNVLDYSYSRHPLKAQAEETQYVRRIGLGTMGMANMFVKLNMRYDSEEAIEFAANLFKMIKETAYDESIELAKEKGSFKGLNIEKHLARDFVSRFPDELKQKLKKNGLRNGCILTIPPTGSIASMAGASGGIEPFYALSYIRRSESLSAEKFEVLDPEVRHYMTKFNIQDKSGLPDTFVVSHKIDPFSRVKMQAAIQQHIDSSISSTVNLPSTATIADVDRIYFYAWELGCKSITIYREGSKENILTATDEKATNAKAEEQTISENIEERPYLMQGTTLKMPTSQGNMYLVINKNDSGQIKEVFIDMGRSGEIEKSYTEAIGRLVSIYLQSGGSVDRVIKTLKGIKGGESVWFNGIQIYSIPDAVAKGIEIVSKNKEKEAFGSNLHGVMQETSDSAVAHVCPKCGQNTLIYENGCYICKTCGYTKCE
ncbi:MAG: adenosylcobalamin-dependent ribonucleoside-diphosphate reductase [Candidatus Parvarchaeota archaeon]|nr:adenosylcobalamin-dependent ribonucleoside-diphosphate reductase [Candidatus Parvarchaeota archaeon]